MVYVAVVRGRPSYSAVICMGFVLLNFRTFKFKPFHFLCCSIYIYQRKRRRCTKYVMFCLKILKTITEQKTLYMMILVKNWSQVQHNLPLLVVIEYQVYSLKETFIQMYVHFFLDIAHSHLRNSRRQKGCVTEGVRPNEHKKSGIE